MSKENSKNNKGTCFVVMGFGKKTDFETGRTLDLDKSYKNMIKPAVEAAGLQCVRADEIVHSGLIDVPMYEQLLNADVVVADLSTSNKNAFYELGIRHALKPFTTVVVAEDGIKTFPFDVNRVLIRQYHHLGDDIGFDEVMRFRKELTSAIKKILKKNPRETDSPIYSFLQDLTPPAIAAKVQSAIQATVIEDQVAVVSRIAKVDSRRTTLNKTQDTPETLNHSALMEQVNEAQKKEDFAEAKRLLENIRSQMKAESSDKSDDPYILQRLALATYKSKQPSEKKALLEAHKLLLLLQPETSNDTETLGLWAAVHKRLWNITGKTSYLDEAIRACERGFYLRNDYYNGINFAFLLNERAASTSDKAEAIADFVQARRVRKEVLTICDHWLTNNLKPNSPKADEETSNKYRENRFWVLATKAEAYLGLGDEEKAEQSLKKANKKDKNEKALPQWMEDTTRDQMKKLKTLLEKSPLTNIQVD